MMFKIFSGLAPPHLTQMFTFNNTLNNYGLRSSNSDLVLPKCTTNNYENSIAFSGAKVLNAFTQHLEEETSLNKFKSELIRG